MTDPHDGISLGIAAPQLSADLVLVSHNHSDHNCVSVVRGSDATVISKPVMTVEKGVRIEGILADHDSEDGSKRGHVTIFRFELDGITFCHLSDIGHKLSEELLDRITPADFLFVPVGDVFTIGPDIAKKVVESVAPKVAIPMHYRIPGLNMSIQPVHSFLAKCDQEQVVRVGNEVDFSEEDLPTSGTEIWVFSL